ncbi:BON domain-containing protein [Vibrio cortegadensis]|uniref:BON domain-containing protein n=1 Tax=Vibrio cortegadensis TaxID=1328770 RepID=A0ABV4M617_9VIBR
MRLLKTFSLILIAFNLTGCAGLFIAGAATTANLVTDTRSTQEIWQDNNLEFEIAAIGNKAPFKGQVRITASSYNGTVVLMGQASTGEYLNNFENKARAIDGVNVIHNQVRVKTPLSVTEMSTDSWITTKVKSALLTDSELNGVKIKVITEDKEVFLLGYVSHQQADIATKIARNISGVKQVIRAFQYAEDTASTAD